MKLGKWTAFVPVMSLGLGGCFGPSPEAVCDHMISLSGSAIEQAAVKQAMGDKDSCVRTHKMRKELHGINKWKAETACPMEAKTIDELLKCPK
jgi:hypothetical protein